MDNWMIVFITCLLARGAWGQALGWTTPAGGDADATTSTVDEDATAATTVETLVATGGTVGGGYTYAIVNIDGDTTSANWKFELSGAVLQSKASQSFDYETKKKYVVVVTAVDNAVSPATITGTVTAKLADIDDNKSTFPTSCGYAALDSISGDAVGVYTVCDDDVASAITYTMTSGDANGYFDLSAGGVMTKSATPFPSNAATSYALVVEARGVVNTATTTVSVVLGQRCTCPGSGSSGLSFGIFTILAAFVLQKI